MAEVTRILIEVAAIQAAKSAQVEINLPGSLAILLSSLPHVGLCDAQHMLEGTITKINQAIEQLIDEARRLGNQKTSEEAATAALNEYINRRKQLEILKFSGTIDFDPTYDYKRNRMLDRIELEP
ncbi:MAG: type II toxin-antitoxin system VapB family antitoxin [Terracidiphilus sp.]|jgi:hypothetical protein